MSTLAALVGSGHEVICFEPGPVMGERSAGSTRIFRLAHTDPELVRVARAAQDRFERWSRAAGQPMLVGNGCVITGIDTADRAAAMAAAGVMWRSRTSDWTEFVLDCGTSAKKQER